MLWASPGLPGVEDLQVLFPVFFGELDMRTRRLSVLAAIPAWFLLAAPAAAQEYVQGFILTGPLHK